MDIDRMNSKLHLSLPVRLAGQDPLEDIWKTVGPFLAHDDGPAMPRKLNMHIDPFNSFFDNGKVELGMAWHGNTVMAKE
jgi:hypothetical protein